MEIYNNKKLNRLICAREYKLSARFGTLEKSRYDNEIRDMLVGCILGDAHVAKVENNKGFITFEQSIKHKDYIIYIYDKLKKSGMDLYDIKYYTRKDSRYGSINSSIYFKTHSLESLYPYVNMFLSNENKKILPLNIKEDLNPITLAHWICDDGQLVKKGGITLCTDNYTLDEVELLIRALVNRYNLKCTIHNKKGKNEKIYHRIYIHKKSLDSIKSIIIPHMHKSFYYKLHIDD